MNSSETLRAREVYRYYQPGNLAELPVASQPSSLIPDLAHVPEETNFNTQQSFSDTALTAFAQLIALRLNCQRAIVSLIDHENEYFLAESTSTFSLIDDDGPAQNAWLSISGARVPRAASLCEQTLLLVPRQKTTAEMTPRFLIPDLRLDPKMSNLDCVKGPPYLRFYCGVALTNKTGVNIGCVYVVDDRPRIDFTLEQAQFLTQMAATIMDHLENIRAKEDIVRVTRMSQALHAFIEGDGTMNGDWRRLKKYNLPYGAGVGFSWETNKTEDAGSSANGKKRLSAIRSHSLISDSETEMSEVQSPQQHLGYNQDVRFIFNSLGSSSSDGLQVPTLKSVLGGVEDAAVKPTWGRDAEISNDDFSDLLRSTFSRASNLVREGMEVDGAVFFDNPFRFYQGRSTFQTDPGRLDAKDSSDSASERNDEENTATRLWPHPHLLPPGQQWSDHANNNDPSELGAVPVNSSSIELKSDILGFSTQQSSSWNSQSISPSTTFAAIDQSLLTSLIQRYPQGELFVIDQEGLISPSSDVNSWEAAKITFSTPVSEERKTPHMARKHTEMLRLLATFPGSKHIFFVPLYDSTSGSFIASFAWSTSATRIFSVENHLSYLIAFGHSVMSEVSRLNTISADRAKGDFISNVSHELRSPLHGILASVEFLADTVLDGFQRSLVDTADLCGRTLLDTIEQVLDFSKIKKFGHESLQPIGAVTDLDVSAVIEEALEGVYAGFEFNSLSSKGLADTTQNKTGNEPSTKEKRETESADGFGVSDYLLPVIIDIDFRDQWKFRTVAGTWRRLTMSVFGNALKYTRAGYIKVKLEARSIPLVTASESSQIEKVLVTLIITDSGPGMSAEFMKTKLFTPFAQEDVTSPGTGLGMSIVKQIIDLLGGTIEIRSDYLGTEIKLGLPLEICPSDLAELSPEPGLLYAHEDPIEAVRRRAGGRTVSIQGFDYITGLSDLHMKALTSLKASVVKYSTEWFNLKLLSGMEAADVAIFDESAHFSSPDSQNRHKILLILCSNKARRGTLPTRLQTSPIVEFVSKPCGPHRLAKALLNCLDIEDAATAAASKENSSIRLSPAVFSPIRTPAGLQTESDLAARRPPFKQRIPSLTESLKLTDMPSSISTSGTSCPSSPGIAISSITGSEPEIYNNGSPASSPPVSTRLPKMLLVEDNPVNMMLLATYMKKNKWEFQKATNGLLALQAFQASPEGFDIIFMDVSMPVMTGYESTKHIRALETQRRLPYERRNPLKSPYLSTISNDYFPFHNRSLSSSNPTSPSAFDPTELDSQLSAARFQRKRPALIIALTAFSSQDDKEMAFAAGMDIFMTKPVKFREVGKILDEWMKSREIEADGVS